MPNSPILALSQGTFAQSRHLLQRRGLRIDHSIFPIDSNAPHVPLDWGVPDDRFGHQGSVYSDSNDPNRKWFLPAFALAEDTDTLFAFAANKTQEIDHATGAPFSKGSMSMMLQQKVPSDVMAALHETGLDRLHTIPLEGLEAAIVVETISNGVPISTSHPATLTDLGGGKFAVVADAILGVEVLALYQNLTQTGTAKCVVKARFQALRIKPRPPPPPGSFSTMILKFEIGPVEFNQTLAIGDKYRADPYRLNYTVTESGASHVIINAEDLRSFDTRQSEYIELHALGDVTTRFPSISKLYFGVLSRTVVAIPNRYVIFRNSGICGASCNALVDSSPGLTAGCKFQFAFTLTPDVSPIDLILLTNEINGRPELELHGASVRLPRAFKLDSVPKLTSPFLTSFSYGPGASDAETIDLAVEIREQLGGQPAIANANMFIGQLKALDQPFLTGSVGILLDDAFPEPVAVPVLVTFADTQPLDAGGMSLKVDAQGKATLENGSSFDMSIDRIAIVTQNNVGVVPIDQRIPAAQSVTLDMLNTIAGASTLVDCEIALAKPLTTAQLFKLLQFRTVDVQNTQFLFAVDATAVDFAGFSIDRIDVKIALAASPSVAIPALLMRKDRRFDNTRVLLPINQALVELKATVLVTVGFIGGARPAVSFTIENDFGQNPTLLLNASNVHL